MAPVLLNDSRRVQKEKVCVIYTNAIVHTMYMYMYRTYFTLQISECEMKMSGRACAVSVSFSIWIKCFFLFYPNRKPIEICYLFYICLSRLKYLYRIREPLLLAPGLGSTVLSWIQASIIFIPFLYNINNSNFLSTPYSP